MWKNSSTCLKMILIFLSLNLTRPEKNDCAETRCSHRGPAIRFPFRIRGIQPQRCAFSRSFDLSCNENNQTLLRLPTSAKFVVDKIDYKSQTVRITDPDTCLPRSLIRSLNLSSSPFQYASDIIREFDLFSCELSVAQIDPSYVTDLPPCFNSSGHRVIAVRPFLNLNRPVLVSCTKMYRLVSIPNEVLKGKNEMLLSWSTPNCSRCETKGNRCGLKSESPKPVTECYRTKSSKGAIAKLVVSGSIIGPFVLAVVAFALYSVRRKKKIKEENQVKVEKFLADYEAFKPTRYSYADIKRITSQFSDELGEGTQGTVYKGKLSDEILVAVKVLKISEGKGEEFVNEVGIIGKIHHVNVVRLVGFCADGFRRALVYEFLPNGSLQKLLSPADKTERSSLGWEKMKDIALGVAKGIEYLHQGCDQRILHFDIKPHNVLLDQNFNPKVSDFGTAKLCSRDQSVVSMTTARGTMGYIAPEVFSRNFGAVSYKSDVFSFGMLLLEMVGSRRKNAGISSMDNESQFYLPEWIYKRLEQGQSLEIDIDEEDDPKIAKNLGIIGLCCIQWQPLDRPSMSVVVKMIEGNEELDMPPNPFVKGLATRRNNGSSLPGRFVQQELPVISELE